MKKPAVNFFFIFSAICLLFSFSFPSDPPPSDTPFDGQGVKQLEYCTIQNHTFQAGEEIVYNIYYNWGLLWISAGEVTFKVEETSDGKYFLKAEGKTYPTYDPIFKVRDLYESYVDKESLLPYRSIREVQEGNYNLYDEIIFDQKRHIATSFRGKTKEKAESTTYELNDCMHDMLSIIYFTRNLDFDNLNDGEKIPVNIFMDKEVWPLEVTYKGKKKKKKIKGKGKFNTIQFTPETIEGYVFKEDSKMDIYVTDDKNRLPLLIESPISVGKIKAVLKSYKGLKYDLTSKVN